MHRRKKTKGFEVEKVTRFQITKLDIFVFFTVLIVFYWAFFINSFKPLIIDNETVTVMTDRGPMVVPNINMQVIIGPLILAYEIIVLIVFDGKRKGRSLPWKWYYVTFRNNISLFLKKSWKDYEDWKNYKK